MIKRKKDPVHLDTKLPASTRAKINGQGGPDSDGLIRTQQTLGKAYRHEHEWFRGQMQRHYRGQGGTSLHAT